MDPKPTYEELEARIQELLKFSEERYGELTRLRAELAEKDEVLRQVMETNCIHCCLEFDCREVLEKYKKGEA
jgi:predicted nuclease with TOPRIM domain